MKTGLKVFFSFLLIVLVLHSALACRKVPECELPVLMYHHFAEDVTADTVVSPQRFREQMTALKNAGYQTVTVQEILDFVDHGKELPEKAILITMDDGYTSNLTIAAPILEELGMCATVFMIGIYAGETISPHSGNQLYPARFSYEAAMPWVEKGVLELQSHTFDMHQLARDHYSGRDGILPLAGESFEAYRDALLQDADAFAARRAEHGIEERPLALAYPYGYYGDASRDILLRAGFRLTLTVEDGMNTLRVNDAEGLWNMKRFNVTERDSGETLLQRLR